jgi:hypothetical protein
MIPNPKKMYQMNTKGTKWSQNIPQSHKIFQIAIKYINTLTTQGPQKFTQFFFGLKTNHLATLRLRRD